MKRHIFPFHLVNCMDTGRWDCSKYKLAVPKLKAGTYKDKKMMKLLKLHCCKTIKEWKRM